MSLTLYALFPDRYVPQHAVLARHHHAPDGITQIACKNGRTMSRVTYRDRIINAMRNQGLMTRAQIEERSKVKKTSVRDHLKALIEQGRVVRVSSDSYPMYELVI